MLATYEDDRVRRRDRASIATGLGLGAGLGALGVLAGPAGLVLVGVGGLAGGVIGKLVGARISPEEWDPPATRSPHVGAYTPDDDIASV
ncbi:MAG TPA: hypothetical protein VKZ18_11340 [Polyangia bacterium]|nr:hypothetical protein [Polyangia bacterium]